MNVLLGIIRGALANLGVQCAVNADVTTVPSCNINLKHIFYPL